MGNTMGKIYYTTPTPVYTTPIYTPHPWVQVFTKGFASAQWYMYCGILPHYLGVTQGYYQYYLHYYLQISQ